MECLDNWSMLYLVEQQLEEEEVEDDVHCTDL